MKTAKISEVIKQLQLAKKQFGDCDVVMSSDEEGNWYGTINIEDFLGRTDNLLILYPWEQERPEAFKCT